MSTTTVIGLTGLPGSGKGEFVRFVQQFADHKCLQFAHYSLSEVLREEARKRGRNIERPVLHEIGNSLREERGPGALAGIVMAKLDQERASIRSGRGQIVVIDAIRTPEEIAVFRRQFGSRFHMVALDAPIDVLTERIVLRARHDTKYAVGLGSGWIYVHRRLRARACGNSGHSYDRQRPDPPPPSRLGSLSRSEGVSAYFS